MDSDTGENQAETGQGGVDTGNRVAPTAQDQADDGTDELRECELADCTVLFPRRGKKKFCTKEHANESARRRTVLETLAVDIPLEELRALRDQVLEQVGPDLTRLSGQLGAVLDRFATLETGAIARIADAERIAADATARADRAEQAQADADRRAETAIGKAEQERAARAEADRARRAAEDRAQARDEDRVRAEAARDAALLAATRADARAELSAEATLLATGRAAEERTRVDALRADLERERAERAAEMARFREETRAASAAVQERHDGVLRALGEQTDDRIEGLRAWQVAEIEGLRARQVAEVEQIRTSAAAEVSAARAEADRATERYTEAARDVERERVRGQAAQARLLRHVRRALGALLDARGADTADNVEESAVGQARRLRDGLTTALRGLDDLADDPDSGEQR